MSEMAEKAVKVLLDSGEEDDFLVHDIARMSLNPGYEFVDAMRKGMGIVRYFKAPDPWAFDLMIRISEEEIPTKLRQIWVKWKRPDGHTGLAPDRDTGGGYASYDVKDADALGRKLASLIKASRTRMVTNSFMYCAYSDLLVLEWKSKRTTRRRRR